MFWLPPFSNVRNVKLVLLQHPEGSIFLLVQKDRWTAKNKNILGYKMNKKNFWVLDSDSHHKWIPGHLFTDSGKTVQNKVLKKLIVLLTPFHVYWLISVFGWCQSILINICSCFFFHSVLTGLYKGKRIPSWVRVCWFYTLHIMFEQGEIAG